MSEEKDALQKLLDAENEQLRPYRDMMKKKRILEQVLKEAKALNWPEPVRKEKPYGQIAHAIYCPDHAGMEWNPEGEAEKLFQAMAEEVITEYERRKNVEQIWMPWGRNNMSEEKSYGQILWESTNRIRLWAECPFKGHYETQANTIIAEYERRNPRELPSVVEIAKAIHEYDGRKWGDKASDMVESLLKANAVIELLKEKR